jgi:hypothetical protein
MQKFPNLIALPVSKNNLVYLVSIKGESATQGTMMIHLNNLPVVIPYWKKIMYRLEEKNGEVFRFYTPKDRMKSGKVVINLVYGKVKIAAALLFDSDLQKRE